MVGAGDSADLMVEMGVGGSLRGDWKARHMGVGAWVAPGEKGVGGAQDSAQVTPDG